MERLPQINDRRDPRISFQIEEQNPAIPAVDQVIHAIDSVNLKISGHKGNKGGQREGS